MEQQQEIKAKNRRTILMLVGVALAFYFLFILSTALS